jgi:hypothetical protein
MFMLPPRPDFSTGSGDVLIAGERRQSHASRIGFATQQLRPTVAAGVLRALIYRGNFRAQDARAINLIRLPNRWASRTLGQSLSETVVLFVRNEQSRRVEVTRLKCCNANMDSRPVILMTEHPASLAS